MTETPDLNELAQSAAQTLVASMASDAWDVVKERVAAVTGLDRRMSDDQRRLRNATLEDQPTIASDLVGMWPTRILGGDHFEGNREVYVGSPVDRRKTFKLSVAPFIHVISAHPIVATVVAIVVLGGGAVAGAILQQHPASNKSHSFGSPSGQQSPRARYVDADQFVAIADACSAALENAGVDPSGTYSVGASVQIGEPEPTQSPQMLAEAKQAGAEVCDGIKVPETTSPHAAQHLRSAVIQTITDAHGTKYEMFRNFDSTSIILTYLQRSRILINSVSSTISRTSQQVSFRSTAAISAGASSSEMIPTTPPTTTTVTTRTCGRCL